MRSEVGDDCQQGNCKANEIATAPSGRPTANLKHSPPVQCEVDAVVQSVVEALDSVELWGSLPAAY